MPVPGEVWWATVIGGDGKPKGRPVVVVSKPMAGTKNVILLPVSSQLKNARPDDVFIRDPQELKQAGLDRDSFISTNFVFTLLAPDLTTRKGSLTPERMNVLMKQLLAHFPSPT